MEFDDFEDVNKAPNTGETLSDLSKDEDQFEDYLSRRANGESEVVEDSTSDDPEVPIIIDDETVSSGVVNDSESTLRSIEEFRPQTKEKRTLLEGREHPIIGKYTVEVQVPAPTYPWTAEVWNNTRKLAISEMSIDQIRKVQEENEEAIAKWRIQNHALRAVEEEMLLKMSPEEAEVYRARRAKDKSYKPKKRSKETVSKGITRTKSGVVRARSAQEKYAKANQDMGLTKAENIEELKTMGPKFWNDEVSKFIDAIYEGE